MNAYIALGIDCGGTHTDAALLSINEDSGEAALIASAKTNTMHEDLPGSITNAIKLLAKPEEKEILDALKQTRRVTLGTTLEINAIVQDKADKVGLALSAGPGINPAHFSIGDHVCIVPGGLDHRGVEASPLRVEGLERQASLWPSEGVSAIACVGKFSPRNPEHEKIMGQIAAKSSGLPVTLGHTLSGKLNFPRRIATAYYNAAVGRLHQAFLDSVEKSFHGLGLDAQFRLLKADGGAIPFSVSRKEPVQSILSGPAASVMGVMALWPNSANGCSLLLDMGGTTTDIAVFYQGSPVIDRQGMTIKGRRTLARSLASVSIGVGGDSLIRVLRDENGETQIHTGPDRTGPAAAFGGNEPTLLDALNVLDGAASTQQRGNIEASRRAMEKFTLNMGLSAGQCEKIAQKAVDSAMSQVAGAANDLVENINSKPIYTLAALKSIRQASPERACLAGGPAQCVMDRLSAALGLPVEIAPYPQVANAIGAALTIPTASLEVYADTGKKIFSAPSLNHVERIPANFSLEETTARAKALLEKKLASEGISNATVEIVESDIFATLDDYGHGARDMRASCQVKPGIVARVI